MSDIQVIAGVAANALTLFGIPAALLAAWKAIKELRNGNEEKVRENRHKQAAAARDALKDLFASEKARAAMQMLDWSGRTYADGKEQHTVFGSDLARALLTVNLTFDTKERMIRDCFEDFFDRLQLIEHYISIEFLNFHDMAVPVSYYARHIVANMTAFEPFLDGYGYPLAQKFLLEAASDTSPVATGTCRRG